MLRATARHIAYPCCYPSSKVATQNVPSTALRQFCTIMLTHFWSCLASSPLLFGMLAISPDAAAATPDASIHSITVALLTITIAPAFSCVVSPFLHPLFCFFFLVSMLHVF